MDKSKINLEFIIVDDNSPDGTGKIAEDLADKYPIRVIHRAGKLGLGTAVIEGFKSSDRKYVGVMDGDMSHNPVIINQMIASLLDNDIAIGSRFEEGGQGGKMGASSQNDFRNRGFYGQNSYRNKRSLKRLLFYEKRGDRRNKFKNEGIQDIARDSSKRQLCKSERISLYFQNEEIQHI